MKSQLHVNLGWEYAPFEIPADIYAEWDAKEAGAAKKQHGNEKFAAHAAAYPELAAEFKRRVNGELPASGKRKQSGYR